MKDPLSNSDRHGFDKLTADILRKYHEGSLTNLEMHQVEKMLLDDPFAAEALEGMEAMGPGSSPEAIESDLNLRIANRVKKEKARVIPIYRKPWNVAAALVLLLAASYLLFNSKGLFNPSSSKTQGPIALEKSIEPERSTVTEEQDNKEKEKESEFFAVTDSISDEGRSKRTQQADTGPDREFPARSSEESQPKQPVTVPAEDKNNLADNESKPEEIIEEADFDLAFDEDIKETDELAKSGVAPPEPVREKEFQSPVEEEEAEVAFSRAAPKTKKLAVKKTDSRLSEKSDAPKIISGQVISAEDGHGLPGVSLSIKGSNKGVYTDINGDYELPVNESDSIVVYSFIGYETEEIIITDKERMDVELEPDEMALEEVVVIGYGNEGETEEFIPVISAQPQGGNSGYKRYLKDSLRYPADALNDKIEGKVKVTFFVQSDGRLSDFQVKRSLGYGCDEEVIRLIKEGPDWRPAKRGETQLKQKVRVKVKFKLKE